VNTLFGAIAEHARGITNHIFDGMFHLHKITAKQEQYAHKQHPQMQKDIRKDWKAARLIFDMNAHEMPSANALTCISCVELSFSAAAMMGNVMESP